MFIRRIFIRDFEVGLRFSRGEFRGLVEPGVHCLFDPFGREMIEIVSQRHPWLNHEALDLIVQSGALNGKAIVLDLKDYERGLVWIDGRFAAVLPPGRIALWTGFREVRSGIIDARVVRFEHPDREAILRGACASELMDVQDVLPDSVAIVYLNGQYADTLPSGRFIFWKNVAVVKLVRVDRRETALDLPGQEMLTADKVSLRLNAMVVYRIVDPIRAVTVIDDAKQSLYREAQLALRAALGVRELDAVLADKDALASELTERLRPRAADFGIEVRALGIRDIILPGDMKDLMNKVTEARKEAEASVITRREEAAALRHQLNAAKLLAENPTLQRMRELEAVEKIAAAGELKVILGDKGLTERVTTML